MYSHSGAYDGNIAAKARRAPAFGFSTSKRNIEYTKAVPGPGAYDANLNAAMVPRHSLCPPNSAAVVTHLRYVVSVLPSQRKAPAYTLGERKFASFRQWEKLGPGRCREDSAFGRQTVSWKRSAHGFSFGSRTPMRAPEVTPGTLTPLHTHTRTITSHYCQGPVPTASSHEAYATFQCRRSTSLAHAGRVAEAVAVLAAVYASPAAAAAAHIGLHQQALPLALPLDRVVAVVESAA